MTTFDRNRKIERLDQLIRLRTLGSPKNLSSRLGISERTVYELLNEMRSYGAEIVWDSRRQSYYYLHPGKFFFGWTPDEKGEPGGR